MSPLLHIRKSVLRVTQAEMATICGARQATVSRWEKGELEPSRHQLDLIRSAAIDRRIPWEDRWFFECPQEAAE